MEHLQSQDAQGMAKRKGDVEVHGGEEHDDDDFGDGETNGNDHQHQEQV